MKISGEHTLNAPVEQVWDSLLDPQVLVSTIPGCESLAATGENSYAMTVTAGVAAIKGTYNGVCRLSDLDPHSSLVMKRSGAGAPGTIDATVHVKFTESGEGATTIAYDADAIVGGMVGGVGQRMLTSVSRKMAGEFFDNVGKAIADPSLVATPTPADPSLVGTAAPRGPQTGQVFTAPARAGTNHEDFLKGVAVGAGLVVLGVVIGSVFGRRR
jgi:carbon monoxide dehydrogenase subunit G